MTLILVAANPHFVVQVSDRRLTRGTQIFVEEEGKSILWVLPSARFLVGYTGLARVGAASMTEVLAEILVRVGISSGFDPASAVEKIPGELDTVFQHRRVKQLSKANRRLSVLITGLNAEAQGYRPLQAHITNFQVWGSHDDAEAWNKFQPMFGQPRQGEQWPTVIQWLGSWDAIDPNVTDDLRQLLAPGKPPRAIRDKLLDLLPEWASAASGRVGRQADSVIVRAGSDEIEERYHSEHASHTRPFTMRAIATPQMQVAFNVEVSAVDPATTRPMVVPAPPNRRHPCPCGSGRQYRHCHERA